MSFIVHHKISELIIKHLRGELEGLERTELDEWINASPENKSLYESLTTEVTLAAEVKTIPELKTRILQTIYKQIPAARETIPIYRRTAFRWIAAACILLIVGISAYVILSGVEGRHKQPPVATTHDVAAPKETRAVITLANGSKVYLDSVSTGTIAQESNVNIIRNGEGEIRYLSPAGEPVPPQREGDRMAGVVYNELFNPRGSKVISLTLSDGTRVWLNSESSLKYPIAFNNNTREVEITGEAYFEVKHNTKQPFKVHLPNGSVVEDIGTSFNINAYPDEDAIKTTLVEGAVKISAPSAKSSAFSALRLKPGEQAQINQTNPKITRIEVQTNVDVDEVMAWKNGRFELAGNTIEPIMRQIARWYDVEVEYKGPKPIANFMGGTSRQANVSELLKILEQTGAVKFDIEGKKIIVSQ